MTSDAFNFNFDFELILLLAFNHQMEIQFNRNFNSIRHTPKGLLHIDTCSRPRGIQKTGALLIRAIPIPMPTTSTKRTKRNQSRVVSNCGLMSRNDLINNTTNSTIAALRGLRGPTYMIYVQIRCSRVR